MPENAQVRAAVSDSVAQRIEIRAAKNTLCAASANADHAALNAHKNPVVLTLFDDAFAPRYKRGESVRLAPAATPRPGDDVVFIEKNNGESGALYIILAEYAGEREDGMLGFCYAPELTLRLSHDRWRVVKIESR